MAKKAASSHMTVPEQVFGGIFFVLYFLALPLAADPFFTELSRLLGFDLPDNVRNLIVYYLLFALTLVIFWNYLERTTRYFFSNFWKTVGAILTGTVGFYGLNEISSRVLDLIFGSMTNLNDTAISTQIQDAPLSTMMIILFLAPFVEDTLFRGYVFGNLRPINRIAAYIVSCLLFAFLHVWQFIVIQRDLSYLPLMLQYIAPGLAFAWTYEKSGTLWGSILLHTVVNALAAWTVL